MAEFDQDDAARAAQARDAIPTLAEVMAADRWVTMPDGGIVPVRLARADGWGQDEDRDSAMAQALSGLVRDMDVKVAAWLRDANQGIDEAEDICRIWQAIRKITRSNGGR